MDRFEAELVYGDGWLEWTALVLSAIGRHRLARMGGPSAGAGAEAVGGQGPRQTSGS